MGILSSNYYMHKDSWKAAKAVVSDKYNKDQLILCLEFVNQLLYKTKITI